MIAIDPENVETIESFLLEYADRSTLNTVESASLWYRDGEDLCHDLARIGDTTLEVAAAVVGALSARERWSSNVSKAYAFFYGRPIRGLSNNLHSANMATVLGFDALNGQKTNAFARALAGDDEAIVIDVWMMRAAGFTKDSPNKTDYAEISEAIQNIAKSKGLSPRTTQALIWILVRGSGE
jgi:hypothetical protein